MARYNYNQFAAYCNSMDKLHATAAKRVNGEWLRFVDGKWIPEKEFKETLVLTTKKPKYQYDDTKIS